MPCRINRARLWTGRLVMESMLHPANQFVTLTYAPEHLPSDGSLCVKAGQDFIKNLRYHVSPRRFRFYLVGEYGDRTFRPHYHAVLFGFIPEDVGVLDRYSLVQDGPLNRAWPWGSVHVAQFSQELARYICAYVTKKMTAREDERLQGRQPEFCRMSLRPGIGAGFAHQVARDFTNSKQGVRHMADTGDVPWQVRWDRRLWPLGRYLREELRKSAGYEITRYERTKAARSRVFDASRYQQAIQEAEKRDRRRSASGERAKFVKSTTFRRVKL